MDPKSELGKVGEAKALEFLVAENFEILETNWLFGHKELDIVARKGAHPTRDKQKYPADAGAPDVLKDWLGKPGHIPAVQVREIVAGVKACHR